MYGAKEERKMKRWLTTSVMGGLAAMFLFTVSAAAQGGELVAAEYGEGRRRVDVTQQVRAFMHDGVLQMEVENSVFGIDPAHEHIKELFIRIRHWDGNVEEFRFPEHAHIKLALDPERGYEWHDRELHIMRAYYGGAGHFVDVTEILRSNKRDGRLSMPIDNRTMGGDPDPEVHKVLRVLYWHEGQRRQVVVPEHAELRLP
jgi:hypothetical protein